MEFDHSLIKELTKCLLSPAPEIKKNIPSDIVFTETDKFGSVNNNILDFVDVLSTTLPTSPLSLIADIFFLILLSCPALILINLEKKVSFLFVNEAVLINLRSLSVAFNNFFKTLFSLEFWIANVCHFFKRIISSCSSLFSNFKLL